MEMHETDMERIAQEKERWKESFKLDQSPKITIPVGEQTMEVETIYTPADLKDFDYLKALGFPGQYPFTRGPYPEMFRHRPWRFSLFAGFGKPEDSRERYQELIRMGQHGINIAPDAPTQMGIDSDDPIAEDDVGKSGVALDTLRDFEIIYEGIPVDAPFATNMEWIGPIIAALLIATADTKGVSRSELRGMISSDPISEMNCKTSSSLPLRSAIRLCMDWSEFCVKNLPKFNAVYVKPVEYGYNDEWKLGNDVAYGFSTAIVYIEELLKRGLNIDDFAPKMSFFFSSSTYHIFEQAAKFRAARRLWAKIVKERYGAKNPMSMALRFTGCPTPGLYTKEQPELNLVRGALGALACILGGCQGMFHSAYDEAYTTPTEKGHRLAMGTELILYHETDISRTVDPLGGSYYVEYLTNRIEQQVVEKMREIEEMGGIVRLAEDGYTRREFQKHWWERERAIDAGEWPSVGRNIARIHEEEPELTVQELDPDTARKQIERLKTVKAERDASQVKASLQKLEKAARGDDNLMPYLIEAAKAYATIGEMTKTLQQAWGAYEEKIVMIE